MRTIENTVMNLRKLKRKEIFLIFRVLASLKVNTVVNYN